METRKAIFAYCVEFVLIMLAFSGCQTNSPVPKTSAIPTQAIVFVPITDSVQWQVDWLKGIPCRPPCWEGIMPGQTTANDAVATLSKSPLISTVVLTNSPWLNDDGYVIWNWANGHQGGEARFQNRTSTQTVSTIQPNLPLPLRLGDVIRAYGEPDYVLAAIEENPEVKNGTIYNLRIIFLSQGFMLSDGGSDTTTLSPDKLFGDIDFFVPTIEGLESVIPALVNHQQLLTPWRGMKSFEHYCRDEYGGKTCRDAK